LREGKNLRSRQPDYCDMKSLVVTARRFCGTGTNTVPMSLRSKRYWIAVASRDHVQNGSFSVFFHIALHSNKFN
jgi:hypothetical protein